MKQVEFLGKLWDVPDWAKWITQDSDDGKVVVWDEKPLLHENGYYMEECDSVSYETIGYHRVLPTIKEI